MAKHLTRLEPLLPTQSRTLTMREHNVAGVRLEYPPPPTLCAVC